MDIATTSPVEEDEVSKFASKFDFQALKRLCKKEVSGLEFNGRICGYTKKNLKKFLDSPQHHSSELLTVIRFMYTHSGYFKKIIQYYINLAIAECWTVDTEFFCRNTKESGKKRIEQEYFKFVKEVSSYNIPSIVPEILFEVFLCDAYFGFEIDTYEGRTLFNFLPEDCIITSYVNGIPCFAVKKPIGSRARLYPEEITAIFANTANDYAYDPSYSQIPVEKSFCVKYNKSFAHLFPPFAFILKEILDLEDFKNIEKAKAKNEIYKLIAMKIPTDDRGVATMSEPDVVPFYRLAMETVAETIGILPTPFETKPIEFSSNTTNNINNVQNAIDEMYSELGVSTTLFSKASTAAEVKISIEADASEVYRILKQIARNINYHCYLRLPRNEKYRFSMRFLNVTVFNQENKVDKLLKMAQASCPVKMELMAAMGYNPAKMFGGEYMENDVFDLAAKWIPMQTSYTQSGSVESSENNGRPEMADDEITSIGQTTRDNEGNDPDNRA